MKCSTTTVCCLVLLVCGSAIAKPPKYRVGCYQYPVWYYQPCLANMYCLQAPLMDDDDTGRTYYAYDTYSDSPCQILGSNFGWAATGLSTPEICPNCQPNQPDARVRGNSHQLKKKLHKSKDELKKVIPAKKVPFICNGKEEKWDLSDAIVNEKTPIDVKVTTEQQATILIRVFQATLDFEKAFKVAKISCTAPKSKDIAFGVELDVDSYKNEVENNPTIATALLKPDTTLFSGVIVVGGKDITITTNAALRAHP